MAFDFPTAPATGTIYAPSGGPTYRYDGLVWSMISTPFQGAFPSDTPPVNPVHGQLWWETDTGLLYVYYTDANSSQWVEVVSSSMPDPPADGNEYVRVNGAWRLKSQTFDLAGGSQLDIQVPSWNPSAMRLSTWAQHSVLAGAQLQISGDGTTFLAGATDYFQGGYLHRTGVAAPGITSIAHASNAALTLYGGHLQPNVMAQSKACLGLWRRGGTGFFAYSVRGDYYDQTAGILNAKLFYNGYATTSAFDRIKAVRWSVNTGTVVTGELLAEWLP